MDDFIIYIWGEILNKRKLCKYLKKYRSRSQCEKHLHFLRRNYQTEEVKFEKKSSNRVEMAMDLEVERTKIFMTFSSGIIKVLYCDPSVRKIFYADSSDFYSFLISYEKWRAGIGLNYKHLAILVKRYYKEVCIPDWFLPDLWNIVVDYLTPRVES